MNERIMFIEKIQDMLERLKKKEELRELKKRKVYAFQDWYDYQDEYTTKHLDDIVTQIAVLETELERA